MTHNALADMLREAQCSKCHDSSNRLGVYRSQSTLCGIHSSSALCAGLSVSHIWFSLPVGYVFLVNPPLCRNVNSLPPNGSLVSGRNPQQSLAPPGAIERARPCHPWGKFRPFTMII